jgi:hypothetical protein
VEVSNPLGYRISPRMTDDLGANNLVIEFTSWGSIECPTYSDLADGQVINYEEVKYTLEILNDNTNHAFDIGETINFKVTIDIPHNATEYGGIAVAIYRQEVLVSFNNINLDVSTVQVSGLTGTAGVDYDLTATGSTVTDLNYSTAQGTWEYNQDNTITYPIGTIVIEEVSVPSAVIANPNNKFIYNHTYDGHGWTDFGTLYDMNGNVVQHNVNLSSTVDITFPMNNQLQQVPVRITLNDVYNSNADFEGAVLEILDHNDQSLYTYILQSGEDFTQTQIYAIPSATAGVRASAILGQTGPGMPPTVKWQLKDSNDILMPFEATPEAWVQTTNLVGELPLWDITIDILSYNYYLTPQATLQRQPILNETTFEYDLYKVLDDGVIVEDFIQTVAADSDGNIIFNTVAIPYENTGNTKYEIRPKAVQFPNLSYDLTPIEITVEQTSPNVMTVTYSKDTFVATVIPILPITGTKQTVYTITCLISLLAIGIYLTKK